MKKKKSKRYVPKESQTDILKDPWGECLGITTAWFIYDTKKKYILGCGFKDKRIIQRHCNKLNKNK